MIGTQAETRRPRGLASTSVEMMRDLLHHRRLLVQMIETDLTGRYVGSSLGIFWSLVHPLALVLIYTLIFSRVMGARLPGGEGGYDYSVFLCAGLLPWVAFQEILTRSTTIFLEKAELVRQVAFPIPILHGSVLGTATFNLVLLCGAFVGFLLVVGQPVPATVAAWPLLLVLHLAFAAGLGLFASVVNVFLRDAAQLVVVLLQFWFWLTPVVYPLEIVPERFARLLVLNPLFHFTRAHQDVVLHGALPDAGQLAILVAMSLGALALGLAFFERLRQRIPDEL